jgi:hypothetical protein
VPLENFPPSRVYRKLPDSFRLVPEFALETAKLWVQSEDETLTFEHPLGDHLQEEKDWMKHAHSMLNSDLSGDDKVSWSAFHASKCHGEDIIPTKTVTLPLFHEKSSSPKMIKHGMDICISITDAKNPNQVISICAFDQPLYALSKYIAWKQPEQYGRNKFETNLFQCFGGLHIEIEMALWDAAGDILEGSGWVNILTEAGVASSGVSLS